MAKSEKQRLQREHKQRQKAAREEWKILRCRGCSLLLSRKEEWGNP